MLLILLVPIIIGVTWVLISRRQFVVRFVSQPKFFLLSVVTNKFYSAVHPCNLPRVEGLGSAQLPRYYFDKYSKQCRPFMYTGKGGNQNNFLGKSDCEAACPSIIYFRIQIQILLNQNVLSLLVVDNPCAEGMPALDSSGQPQFCSTANPDVCPESHWCHVGANAASTLCCPGCKKKSLIFKTSSYT